jgi:hypothetical protein
VDRGRLTQLLVLAAAFGVLEACTAVVLRRLVDPTGEQFPLVTFPPALLRLEQVREAGSLLLLVAAAWLAGSRPLVRWGAFLVAFGMWDLVYYAALRVAMAWPARLATWDLLFLLPRPWYGPVYAPALVATMMLGCGLALLHEIRRTGRFIVERAHMVAAIVGAALILGSFILPGPSAVMTNRYCRGALVAGLAIGLGGFADAWRRTRRAAGGSPRMLKGAG